MSYPSITDCSTCRHEWDFIKNSVNVSPDSKWKRFLREIRCSIGFVPQQNVDLSMTRNRIPPWVASSGRLLSELCHLRSKNQATQILVLLDSMVSLFGAVILSNFSRSHWISMSCTTFVVHTKKLKTES